MFFNQSRLLRQNYLSEQDHAEKESINDVAQLIIRQDNKNETENEEVSKEGVVTTLEGNDLNHGNCCADRKQLT